MMMMSCRGDVRNDEGQNGKSNFETGSESTRRLKITITLGRQLIHYR